MQHVLLALTAASKSVMKRGLLIILALPILFCAVKPVDAGGMGRFLGSLVARGAVRGAIIAGRSQSDTYAPKVYSADVLTVEQLALCIKQATKLDGDNDWLEIDRRALLASKSEIDASSAAIELQRPRVDHYSQQSINGFNALIDRYNALVTNGKVKQASFNALVDAFNVQVNTYNANCAKKYYADDLPDAQKLAAHPQ
jgi:hypothetical protein